MNRKIIEHYLKEKAGKDYDIMVKFGAVATEAVNLENISFIAVICATIDLYAMANDLDRESLFEAIAESYYNAEDDK